MSLFNRRRRRQQVEDSASKIVYNSSTISSTHHILDPLGRRSATTLSHVNLREVSTMGGTGGAGIYSHVQQNTNNQSSALREQQTVYAAEQLHHHQQQQRVILPASVPPSLNTILSNFQQNHHDQHHMHHIDEYQYQQQQQQQLQQQQHELNQSLSMSGAGKSATAHGEFDNYSQLGGGGEHTTVNSGGIGSASSHNNTNPNIYDGSLSMVNATATVIIGQAAAFSSANSMMQHNQQQQTSSKQSKSISETSSAKYSERARMSSQVQQDTRVEFLNQHLNLRHFSNLEDNYMNFDASSQLDEMGAGSGVMTVVATGRLIETTTTTRTTSVVEKASGRQELASESFTRMHVVESPVPSEARSEEQEMSMFVTSGNDHGNGVNEIVLKHSNNTIVINKDFD
jgi:hypothetical protein